MISLTTYIEQLERVSKHLSPALAQTLAELSQQRLLTAPHGDWPKWQKAIDAMPAVAAQLQAAQDTVALLADEFVNQEQLVPLLRQLMPWRKGPFDFFGLLVDTEWRSDWKWQRIQPHLSPLKGRRVLDVGCGSGYHLWRMWAEGADQVLGVDPTLLFLAQFLSIKQYAMDAPVWFAPVKMEELPPSLECFDTVFSMGVLYHRKSPLEHLEELQNALRPGGELVLETLVVEGDETTLLMPQDRYAMMRNVWFLPSVPLLERWLARLGFTQIRTVDVNQTSQDEQRATSWMTFQSLADFLRPDDNALTHEGYPAPRRATVLATKR